MRERGSGLSQKLRQAARNMLYNRSNTKETNIDICLAAPYKGLREVTGFTFSGAKTWFKKILISKNVYFYKFRR